MKLNWTDNPCVACGREWTIGVAYSAPDETKWWCREHLPPEFRAPAPPPSPDEVRAANAYFEGRWDDA